jgi:putative ABC transport system permease protein
MRHIVKPLLRHRLMPLLVVLQVALACAIACNAFFLLQQRLVPIVTPDGVGEPDKLIVAWHIVSRGKPWPQSRLQEVQAALRAVPGVAAVSVVGSFPMETTAQMNGNVLADGTGLNGDSAVYIGDNLVDMLGLKLVAGRDFSADEKAVQYKDIGINASGPAIITRALAGHLFPDGKALGKVVRIGDDADAGRRTVVGVVEHLMRNKLGQDDRDDIDYSMLFPGTPGMWPMPIFGVRTDTTNIEPIRAAIKTTIERQLGNELMQGVEPQYEMYASLRERMLARSKAAVWLLAGVSLVVLIVTLAGIMGLTSYWVQQRTRQIGVRRALGAKRSDILRAVQIENLLVVGVGVVLGLGAAYAINLWLMRHYELARLPGVYLPLGAALMLVLGQIAVLGPALRASRVPPVVATRAA